MGAIASQITSLTIAYSIVYSDTDERKHQSSVSLAFVQWIHRGLVNSPHKWPATRKMFPFDDVIIGDFHAIVTRDSLFRLQLLQFCEDNCYTLSHSMNICLILVLYFTVLLVTRYPGWTMLSVASLCMRSSQKWMCYIIIWCLTMLLSICIQIGTEDKCPNGWVDDETLIKFRKIGWTS